MAIETMESISTPSALRFRLHRLVLVKTLGMKLGRTM
jgi:hypothetical protein